MKLGEILLRRKLISQQQLNEVLTEQQLNCKPLGELLVEHSAISKQDLEVSLQEQKWRKNGFWVIK
ncbi:MAG: hypothetical protein HC866_02615 [Leptolyngbyaceae cyanobacterium RU_5_1]|nr:hypothetical protein [Leptolyngbyaceae cyanobacterium RU_5_1]